MLIDCECHGTSITAVVCGHLVGNVVHPLGFIENCADPHDLQGWCYACEYVFLQKEEMTQKFREFNKMSVVCGSCYAEIKAKHESPT